MLDQPDQKTAKNQRAHNMRPPTQADRGGLLPPKPTTRTAKEHTA